MIHVSSSKFECKDVCALLKVIWSFGKRSEIFQENSHLFDFHLKAYYVCAWLHENHSHVLSISTSRI